MPKNWGMNSVGKTLGSYVDRAWDAMASVKLTMVILSGLLFLAIPGTVILQYNISNVDPGLQYSYDFWNWGQHIQLFSMYHSFWYVGLMVILSLNLIACSVNRWPQMLKLAIAKPVKWGKETFLRQPKELRSSFKTKLSKEEAQKRVAEWAASPWSQKPVFLKDEKSKFQLFWQVGRWSRVANYLVHTSLLVIFAGGIVTALYGFEGAANIPSGGAVDTLIVFKEGKLTGLQEAPGGLINEKLLGFRIRVKDFIVNFYEDWPGRPKDFISRIQIQKDGVPVAEKSIRVNDPIDYKGVYLYQASYGRLGDFEIKMRIIDKENPVRGQRFQKVRLGEPLELDPLLPRGRVNNLSVVALQAMPDVQGFGPGVQLQEMENGSPIGKPFWILQQHEDFDFRSREDAPYGLVLDDVEELYFTGLQIGYDPGAPIYWWGCFGMLVGTFYALFVTHRKYYIDFDEGEVHFAGAIHRLPFGFERAMAKKGEELRVLLEGEKADGPKVEEKQNDVV